MSDAEAALKMMMMTGSAAVPLAALQAAGYRQRVQHAAAAASYLTSAAGLRHAAPLTAITPPAMYVHTQTDKRTDRQTPVKAGTLVLFGARHFHQFSHFYFAFRNSFGTTNASQHALHVT